MRRRRLVALVSACVLLAIGLVAVFTGWVVMRTQFGREQIRRIVQERLSANLRGRVYVGHIGGTLLDGLTIDSIAIRDVDDDSLFISSGPVRFAYDPRDLIDKRIWLRRVDVQHPHVYLRQHESGRWNFKEIFRNYDEQKPGPRTPGRSFGDYVRIDSARLTDGRFVLQMPWHPDDTLHGVQRDSAIAYTLGRPDKEIRRIIDDGKPAFARTWRWTNANAFASHLRIADPDSNRYGRVFLLDSLAVDESDPPFRFRDIAHAQLRNLGDSMWVEVPHFALPASAGSGRGKLWWGNDLPLRVDIAVRADSVSLADVNWVYNTLPTRGGGTTLLHIGNERDARIMDYALTNMDVRSTRSHLRGDMTFGVGGPVLIVKNVRLNADPVDFDLLRTINGKPFPVDWQGQLYGDVKARGGGVNHFVVDNANATWRDTHVRGAVSRFGGKGELDILYPAITAFHRFDANVQSLDLRSIEYLFPNFPRLGGTIAGTALLDSSWLDLRFTNADVFHRDGPGEPSHITGNGRVTWGEKYMTYDVDLDAAPLSLSMLARSYPKLPFQGLVSGPVKAKGTTANLQLGAALQGAAGAFSFNGLVDIDTPSVAVRGTGQFTALDANQLLRNAAFPTTLNGQYEVDVAGDSLANLQGMAALHLDRSMIDSVRFFPSTARMHFADGRLRIDSLRLETAAAAVTASGGLGLPHGPSDSLLFAVDVDSLGGLRRYIGRGAAPASAGPDSLSGTLGVDGVARGRIDSLDLAGRVFGSNIYVRKDRGHTLAGRFALRDVLANPVGTVSMRLDTITLAGVALDSIGGSVNLAGRSSGTFTMGAVSRTGPALVMAGGIARGAGDALLVGVTSLTALIDRSEWTLGRPAHVRVDSTGTYLDSLLIRRNGGGQIAAAASLPLSGPVRVDVGADSVPLADLGAVAQLPTSLDGRANLEAHVSGTRASPVVSLRSVADDLRVGGSRIERVTTTGSYDERRFDAAVAVLRGGAPALTATASLPVDLSSFRFRLLDDSLRGSIRSDSADLAILEALTPAVQRASGRLTANLDIGGTWHQPTVGGNLLVASGDLTFPNLGIRVRGIAGDIAFVPGHDSMVIRRLTAWSGRGPEDRISLAGFVSFADIDNPLLGLRLDARNFHAIDKRSLARLDISTGSDGLQLQGRDSAATLAGTIRVDRGVLFLPESDLRQKQLADLTTDEAYAVLDTSDLRTRSILPEAPPGLVQNLRLGVRVDLGDDVWLRSNEADIKLGGSLNVTRAPDVSRRARTFFGRQVADGPQYRLTLEGTLNAQRGTYTLDLGAVQRTFQVQSGTITFNGEAEFNPYIDVSARYDVKRPRERDLPVIVHLHGPFLPNPVLDFSSTENYEISPTDLISYLITGLPSFQVQESLNRTAAQVLLPTASSVLARGLRTTLGSWVDMVQFGATDVSTLGQVGGETATQAASDFLLGARLGGETQVGRNLFFSFSAGLCPLAQPDPNLVGLAGALGGKLEYRVSSEFSLIGEREPPTRLLYCGRNASEALRSLVPTPPQWGLSLLRTWRF